VRCIQYTLTPVITLSDVSLPLTQMIGIATSYVTTPFPDTSVANTVSATSAVTLPVIAYIDEYSSLLRLLIRSGLRLGQERRSQE
jgi:hypothetical protein